MICGLAGLVFWRLGRRFLAWLGLTLTSKAMKFCFETAMGILFLNGLWLGLGLNGLWFKSLSLVLGLFLAFWALWDWGREGIRRPHSIKIPQGPFLLVSLLALAFIGLNLAQALLPETYFDALVYHLSVLQFWDLRHGMAEMPGNLYAHFPFGGELYLWNGFLLGSSQAAKLLNVGILILTSLAGGAWVAEEGNPTAGGLTAASILFLPLLATTSWAAQNDVFVAFFFLLFVYVLVKWPKGENNHWFIAAGLMGGAALSAKYTALLGLWTALAVCFFTTYRSRFFERLNQWASLKVIIFLSLAPWLIKNYLFTGNPFYPYFPQWLGGQSIPPDNLAALMLDHETPWVVNHSWLDWMVQVFTRDLDKTIAPLLLAFIPFFFLRGSWKSSTRYLFLIGFLYLLSGFALSHQLRLAIPAIVLLLTAMGMVLSGMDQEKNRSWAWVVLAFGLFSFVSLARVGVSYYHWGEMGTGFKTEKEYLETTPQTQGYYALAEAAQALTKPSDRLLIVGDARSLYFSRDFYANSVFDPQLLAVLAQTEKDSEGIWRRLKESGIDDLAVSGDEGRRLFFQYRSYYPLSESEWAKLDDFIERRTDLRFISGRQGMYHLRETPQTIQKPIPDLLLGINSGFQGKI